MTRPRRFLPPIAGGAQTTGWEALEKWVGSAGEAASGAVAATGKAGKTGWEALEKWVGSGAGGGAAASEAGATNGSAAAETVPVTAGSAEAPAAGGLLGFFKRLFGGK